MKGVLFLVKISILKGKGLNLWTEPPCTKLYSVAPPGAGTGAHCPSFVCETLCVGSILELNCCLLSYVIRDTVPTEGTRY